MRSGAKASGMSLLDCTPQSPRRLATHALVTAPPATAVAGFGWQRKCSRCREARQSHPAHANAATLPYTSYKFLKGIVAAFRCSRCAGVAGLMRIYSFLASSDHRINTHGKFKVDINEAISRNVCGIAHLQRWLLPHSFVGLGPAGPARYGTASLNTQRLVTASGKLVAYTLASDRMFAAWRPSFKILSPRRSTFQDWRNAASPSRGIRSECF